ncbi:hypothetical protein SVIO_025140 [Streptomyces violaceusniger]|uniref:Uncharacterized protein n=1 Tax=Streptomyces violaceusniger TaxID=68280 RepID=A0A4D4KRE7_STRVO|nr:hypothetical protein SVIO_025140 [Streptomyces violaceusniger]
MVDGRVGEQHVQALTVLPHALVQAVHVDRDADVTGCLGVQGSLAAGDPGRNARDDLIVWRNKHTSLLRDRFKQAVDEGDPPPAPIPAYSPATS